jgi:hypothetical protein
MNSVNPKPVFLYLDGFPLSDRQLKKIKDAGYVAVPVKSFDSVKIVEPALLWRSDPVAKAAFSAISEAPTYNSETAERFGRKVAKALATDQ